MNTVAEQVISGDVRGVARLIRDIDDDMPGVRDILKDLYPYVGNACVIGITGPPGVGKSTVVDRIITCLRKQNKTVGVLAVDPTSPFSGGAILGDRIRMQRHSMDDGVFIHSLATRGYFGGLTQSTRSAIDVLDAMGKKYILVETVGVGQDEVDIGKTAHTTVIVLMPGMGDDIQAIKAGVLEVGDIFLINKADRENPEKTVDYLRWMIDMNKKKYDECRWKPTVLTSEALFDRGIKELLEEINKHSIFLIKKFGGLNLRKRKDRVQEELVGMAKKRIVEEVMKNLVESGEFDNAVRSVVEGKVDPYTACDKLFLP